ncbi:MAG: hypothetical protein M3N46_03690 [Actinomycetota bacterium]|nr:hypothetical protein [Actinomycetota bacterium]
MSGAPAPDSAAGDDDRGRRGGHSSTLLNDSASAGQLNTASWRTLSSGPSFSVVIATTSGLRSSQRAQLLIDYATRFFATDPETRPV